MSCFRQPGAEGHPVLGGSFLGSSGDFGIDGDRPLHYGHTMMVAPPVLPAHTNSFRESERAYARAVDPLGVACVSPNPARGWVAAQIAGATSALGKGSAGATRWLLVGPNPPRWRRRRPSCHRRATRGSKAQSGSLATRPAAYWSLWRPRDRSHRRRRLVGLLPRPPRSPTREARPSRPPSGPARSRGGDLFARQEVDYSQELAAIVVFLGLRSAIRRARSAYRR